MKRKALLLGSLVLLTAFAGCLGGNNAPPPPPPAPPEELDQEQFERLEVLAAEIRNYTLPGSLRLEPVVKWFNGTIGTEANTAYQDRNMRGGNDFNTQIQTFDISGLVPIGQPTALRLKLVYFGSLGSSAKASIYACVPGHCTRYNPDNNDEFNWKASVEIMNVVTVGAPGEKHEVGVAVSNGKVAQPLSYALEVQATYFQDVLTPYHAYAFTVPEGATGVTLKSVKPGQEHMKAKFIVLDPQDGLVSYTDYDDIAIPSESIFIPTRQPGEYVFYAQEMVHGFFSIVSDAPLGNFTALRLLPVTRNEGALGNGPLSPGVPERDVLGGTTVDCCFVVGGPSVQIPKGTAATPYTEGAKASFSVDGFPLEMGTYIKPGLTGAAEIRITSAKGLVYTFQRMLRYDAEQGSLGYTRDETNVQTDWSMLAPGAYSVSFLSDGETGEMGYWVKTFSRLG